MRGPCIPQYALGFTAKEQSRAGRLSMERVDSLMLKLNIDPERIYVTGLSLGGEAALMKSTPLWISHGDGGDMSSVEYSRAVVKALTQEGVPPR